MAKRDGPHPPPLPPLRKDSRLHQTVMDAIKRGGATSWSEAFGVSLYISQADVREASQAWLDYYGVPRSRFHTLLVIGEQRDKTVKDSG